ncbi:MAG: hypothetical protein WAM91_07530 [Candidatus Acidiferrales bacterium]
MDKIVRQVAYSGRYLFAIAITAFGALHFIFARYGEPRIPIIPFFPNYTWLAYLTGAIFLAAGVCIAINFRPLASAMILGMVFLFCVLVLQISRVAADPGNLGVRTVAFETLAICGSAFALAGNLRNKRGNFGEWETIVNVLTGSGPYVFAICAVVFGVDHLQSIQFVGRLVPQWIPGSGVFWAWFTGIGFILAGVSIATKVMARWGAFFLGLMFLLWFLLLHLPRVTSFPRSHNPAEWSSAFIALAMCGGGWICAWSSKPDAKQ